MISIVSSPPRPLPVCLTTSTSVCVLTFVLVASVASAQPSLTVDRDVVVPGSVVTATVTGVPGQHFAVIGSTVGAGASHAGVALSVGPDLAILAIGVIDGTGQAVVGVNPPFRFTVLDRYYIQAAISSSPAFTSIQASAGKVLRNADLVAGIRGSAGPPGPPGPEGPSGTSGSCRPRWSHGDNRCPRSAGSAGRRRPHGTSRGAGAQPRRFSGARHRARC